MKRLFKSHVINGQLTFVDKPKWISLLQGFEDKDIGVVIGPWSDFENRTLNMNAYLHVCFTVMGNYLGYTMQEMKDAAKLKMGYVKKKHLFDLDTGLLESTYHFEETSKMSIKKLSQFINELNILSIEITGSPLPPANDYYE